MNAYDFYLKKFTKSAFKPPSGEDVASRPGAHHFPGPIHHHRAAVNKLMIFCTDPSLGNFDYAVEVFRFIKDPCLFVYDVMIKAFAKMSSFRSAVELFWRLKEEELCPYKLTYPFVLKPLDAWDVGV
ncbi:pentatricopeptide repeat-containing protein [Pyrus ussuriensis x Pyrus communis]|uniref:Pentatricopeptide repeat-containing protein n=1 Tax=Pyrus ussuriensis x Pyrus communis TaxID=2448454 RepID=A0A5N5GY58_9ROSA|nr:pentatricopeptide repeat-containing protein [Pyrus ussuriensis x Pyrus communis]